MHDAFHDPRLPIVDAVSWAPRILIVGGGKAGAAMSTALGNELPQFLDRIEGVVVSFVDITERRQTEEALRESEQKLRQEKRLVELSGEPILVWEFDDGSILDWNRGCEELYGYRREEARFDGSQI